MKISYSVKRKRTKGIRLTVSCDGQVKVTAPYLLGNNLIEKFVFEKSKWILSKLDYFKKKKYVFLKSGIFKKNKDLAYGIVKERVDALNRFYGFKYGRITIRNQKSRWASCSKKGNLNFSYKLAFLPPEVRDYIIVHELCHLKEFNHSFGFWKLVSQSIPDYIARRKSLKRIRFV